ncbi:hypothetical protein yc1106_09065 [Curvularia clavata]|uniref:Uncharacterized protein n=1 Tax=Curvularia clavata TaxID=95742 RepID=A0A9Q8ZEF6_CURCL|nr:hypothetical protein yc1106_09065 [Curvularia clavata]
MFYSRSTFLSFPADPPALVKGPSHHALATSGIPDHRDVLAIYFRWVRQRYFQFHEGMMQQDGPSSAASTRNSDDALDALNEIHGLDSGAPLANLSFDAQRLSTDLLEMGAGFGGNDALMPGYPSELELIG